MKYFLVPVLSLALILLSALSGVVVALESDVPGKLFGQASYAVRTTLGLEKSWQTVPGPDQARDRQAVACPDPSEAVVVVTGGQSNAANVIPSLHRPVNDVSVWFDGTCYRAADPLLGALGRNGSLWSLLGDRMSETLGRPVLLINGAIGGTQFADWLDARSGYYAALFERVAAAGRSGYRPDLILWHQGETDAAVARDMAGLEREITALMDRFVADVPSAQVYLFRATRCVGKDRVEGVPAVNETLRRVAARHGRTISGFDTDTLGREFRWDTCHFNSLGRERIVDRVVPELVRYFQTARAE